MHLEFLLVERSAEVALSEILPIIIPENIGFKCHVFQGKEDLLKQLPNRLKGYRQWIQDDWRIVVLIDEDRKDCLKLKQNLENVAHQAGFYTKSNMSQTGNFQVVNRIAIEELEAWFFGDPIAIRNAYPKVSKSFHRRSKYRNPEKIQGGTSEALERLLRQYYPNWFPKVEVARNIAAYMQPERNISRSFQVFVEGVKACVENYNV